MGVVIIVFTRFRRLFTVNTVSTLARIGLVVTSAVITSGAARLQSCRRGFYHLPAPGSSIPAESGVSR